MSTTPAPQAEPDRSVWVGRPGGPPWRADDPGRLHGAASTMKVAVLAALFRAADAGALDLDAPVRVVNDFASALGDGSRYRNDRSYDDEDEVWTHLGDAVPARWLARRMIVRSSNLATNLLLARVGLPAVAEAWRIAGATGSVTARGIEDYAARDAGRDNLVTAADLAALFSALHHGTLARPDSCAEMLDLLAAQEWRQDLALGVPGGVRIAHKNGWMTGVRHSAGIVYPPDADPYVIAVCTTARGAPPDDYDEQARRRIAEISAEAWAGRSSAPTVEARAGRSSAPTAEARAGRSSAPTAEARAGRSSTPTPEARAERSSTPATGAWAGRPMSSSRSSTPTAALKEPP